MATTCTFLSYGPPGVASGTEISGTISLADASFLNITDPVTPVVTTITADLQQNIVVTPAQGVTAGIPPGQYEKVGPATFRRTGA